MRLFIKHGNQLHEDLGVRFGAEHDAPFVQPLLYRGVILDDAVVDEREHIVLIAMGMRIDVRRRTVASPSGCALCRRSPR